MYRVRSPTGHSASGKCSHRVHSSPEVSEQAAAQGGGKNSRVRDLSDRAQKHYRSREIPNSITQQVRGYLCIVLLDVMIIYLVRVSYCWHASLLNYRNLAPGSYVCKEVVHMS